MASKKMVREEGKAGEQRTKSFAKDVYSDQNFDEKGEKRGMFRKQKHHKSARLQGEYCSRERNNEILSSGGGKD